MVNSIITASPSQALGTRISKDIPPSWEVNFLRNGLPAGMTFGRMSIATGIGSTGAMQTVAADVLRKEYHPVTLAPRGILLEVSRTNLLLNSAALASQIVSIPAGVYTISFYGNGSITAAGAASFTLAGAGTFPLRSVLVFNANSGNLVLTVSGSVQFAQLEAGRFQTSYIPTTNAQGTRASDMLGSNGLLSSIGFNPVEGTFLLEYEAMGYASRDQIIFSVEDNAKSNRVYFSIPNYSFQAWGGINSSISNGAGLVQEGVCKHVMAYRNGDNALFVNGMDRTGALASALHSFVYHAMMVGSSGFANTSAFCGWLRRICYYPARLPNALLQELTS